MLRKTKIVSVLMTCVLFLGLFFENTASAGLQTSVSDVISTDEELNNSEWNFTGDGYCEDGKIIIPTDASMDTKLISKIVAEPTTLVEEMISAEGSFKLVQLPAGEEFVFAFGLSGIEADTKEDGNIEIVVTNENGLKLGVTAYEDGEAVTVLASQSVGISLNREFLFSAEITNNAVLKVYINGSKVCEKQLPVSGKGRFGILQSGNCGAEISAMTVTVKSYERPQNTDFEEDFEDGGFNANLLCSRMTGVATYGAGCSVQDYNGNKIWLFKNTSLGFLGTRQQYSNFEISFDIVYWQAKREYDEYGTLSLVPGNSICIGFGELVSNPTSATYASESNMDYVRLYKTKAVSGLRKAYNVTYDVEGMPSTSEDVGYSVKLSVVDGYSTLQVKPLSAEKYTTVAETDYGMHLCGYINIWMIEAGTIGIDNLKITNLDEEPNLIEVEHKSSILTFEDYDITQESTELVFRPEEDTEETKEEPGSGTKIYVAVGVACAIVIIAIGAGIVIALIRKNRRDTNENE